MLEIPEAATIAGQINQTLSGKIIKHVIAAQHPHGFAWYSGDPAGYPGMLAGKKIAKASNPGGMIEIEAEDVVLLFSDGINLRYHQAADDQPPRHQLLLGFDDGTALSATVAMYGGLLCFASGTIDNPYYLAARQKPSPLSDEFTRDYFSNLFQTEKEKYSLKAFLATEQRIPGLGNGVLQDILFTAKLHPKRKAGTLTPEEKDTLYRVTREKIREMAALRGRDTEKDLFGNAGGYQTLMSKNTVGKPCPVCGSLVVKQAYLGGSIYFCPGCQKEN